MQSFDWRTLVAAKKLAPEIETVCLTIETDERRHGAARQPRASPWLAGLDLARPGGSVPRLVKAAGCGTWSPFWRNVTPELVDGSARARPQGGAVDGERPGRHGAADRHGGRRPDHRLPGPRAQGDGGQGAAAAPAKRRDRADVDATRAADRSRRRAHAAALRGTRLVDCCRRRHRRPSAARSGRAPRPARFRSKVGSAAS